MTNEIKGGGNTLSNDINVITAEINTYKRIAGEAIFEIGYRLKGVRDNPKEYGFEGYRDWERWCDVEFGFTRNYANRLVKISEELGDTYHPNLGQNALYLIATLPTEQREVTHTTGKGEEKLPEEMTVKELRELKRQLKQTEQERDAERKERERLERETDKPPEVRTEYVEPDDYEALQIENETYRRLYGDSSIYEGNERRVGNDDAITYNVLEFSEDVRRLIEKYGHLTHFPKEFNDMIPEGKQQFETSITNLMQFLKTLSESMNEDIIIINQ